MAFLIAQEFQLVVFLSAMVIGSSKIRRVEKQSATGELRYPWLVGREGRFIHACLRESMLQICTRSSENRTLSIESQCDFAASDLALDLMSHLLRTSSELSWSSFVFRYLAAEYIGLRGILLPSTSPDFQIHEMCLVSW